MDIEKLKITDIIKEAELNSLKEMFSTATGMAVTVLNRDENFTGSSRWCGETEFCAGCVKKSAKGAEHCKKFTQKLVEDAKSAGRTVVYICHTGAAEFAAPVVAHGVCVGYVVGGQVFVNKPDSRKCASIAHSFGIDAAEYTAAAESADVSTEARIGAAAELFAQMISDEAEAGYFRAESAERGALARDAIDGSNSASSEITRKINETMTLVSGVENACERIKNAVASSAKAVDNTDAIVKTIENSSTQLTLIGFNASIEAKRAGAAGAGFNVIAQEVRTLAERNTKQAVEIEKTLNGIKRSMGDINNQIRNLYGDIEKISDSMNELSYATFEVDKAASSTDE